MHGKSHNNDHYGYDKDQTGYNEVRDSDDCQQFPEVPPTNLKGSIKNATKDRGSIENPSPPGGYLSRLSYSIQAEGEKMVAAEEKVGPPLVATKQAEEQSSHGSIAQIIRDSHCPCLRNDRGAWHNLCSDRLC